MSSIAPLHLEGSGGVTSQRPVSLLGWSLALVAGLAIWSALIALLI